MVILLAACSAGGSKGAKPSKDWSRSLLVGDHSNSSVGLAVNEDNQQVSMVWTVTDDQGMSIRFTRLNNFYEPSPPVDIRFPGQLRYPRLLLAGQGNLHLFWASRVPGEPQWSLWHAILTPDGELVGEAGLISTSEDDVGAYEVTSDLNGGAVVAWSHRSRGGIYLSHLGQDGQVISGRVQISAEGESPAVRIFPRGGLNLAWMTQAGVYYLGAPLEDLEAGQGKGQLVADIRTGTGDSLMGPQLGLSDGWVYLLWSTLHQSGLEAGTAQTEFIAFPQGAPEKKMSNSVALLPEEEQIFEPYQGGLALTQLVKPPQEAWAVTDFVMQPAAMLGENTDLAVSLSANQQIRLNTYMQIAVAVLVDGEYQGYSYVSKSEKISDEAVVYVGPSGNLYVVWREGVSGSDVYYSSTNPVAMAALDSVTLSDVSGAALEGGLEILVSVAFMPFVGFGWIVVGLIVVGGFKLIRDDDDLSNLTSWVPLVIGFVAYYAVKLATLPTMMSYVPFSAWIYVPSDIQVPLMIGVPITIFFIALLVAHLARRKYGDSATLFYLIASITDAILTLAIYGVNFLGVI